MKIVTASKFYYQRAGLEAYLFKITELLKSYGHDIIPFSTSYKENIETEYNKYFAEYIDISGSSNTDILTKLKAFSRIFYNLDAKDKIAKLFDETKPDLLWGFGVHRHLSPSIFIEAKERNIPVIHRLSDYATVCPCSTLRKGNGKICENFLCPTKGYHNAVINKCVLQSEQNALNKSGSIAASIVGSLELQLHKGLGLYANNVDKFIAPSEFLRQVMIKSGIDQNQICHIPIFINANNYEAEYESQPYLVYFGRLTEEKGLSILLDAMKISNNCKLFIVGDGPQKQFLEKIIEENSLNNVKYLGKKSGEELKRIIKYSRLVIVPSVWFDNSPNVIVESFALGKPVIASNIGGIPEYIDVNNDGLLYEPTNSEELASKIKYLMQRPGLCKQMGINGRKKVETIHNPSEHYNKVKRLLNSLKRVDRYENCSNRH